MELDTVLTLAAKPDGVVSISFLHTISDFPYEKELALIDQVGGQKEIGFDNVRLTRVSMGTYTWGYALVPKANKSTDNAWFWCIRAIGEHNAHQFYKLSDFLDSYWKDVKTQNEMHRRYC